MAETSLTRLVAELLDGPHPLPIVTAGDPVLRQQSEPYDWSLPTQLWSELLLAMRECMLAAPGVGLAAPQIGLGIAVAVIEDGVVVPTEISTARDRRPTPFRVLVNPSYQRVGESAASFYEGCLSIPGYQAVVERSAEVRLRCLDETGAPIDEIVGGWPARIVAHETDHLNGMLYLDKAFTRSLATSDAYLDRWSTPTPQPARVALGF